MLNNYLGQKGYTIYKKNLSLQEQLDIKDDLTVTPNVAMSIGKVDSFSIYREADNKLYVPRFYGEKNLGLLKDNRLTKYETIDLKFNGEMRDYQNNIVSKYINHIKHNGGYSGGAAN